VHNRSSSFVIVLKKAQRGLILPCELMGALFVPPLDLTKPASEVVGADFFLTLMDGDDEIKPAALVHRVAGAGRLVGRRRESPKLLCGVHRGPVLEILARLGGVNQVAEPGGDGAGDAPNEVCKDGVILGDAKLA